MSKASLLGVLSSLQPSGIRLATRPPPFVSPFSFLPRGLVCSPFTSNTRRPLRSTPHSLRPFATNTQDAAQEAAQEAEDLLNLAQSLSRTPMNGNTEMRCTIYRPDQPPEAIATGPMSKHDISREFGLSPRDLRTVDLKSEGSPHILIRHSTILIHMFSLRLLIQADRVAVLHIFDNDNHDGHSAPPEPAAAAATPEHAHEQAMTVAGTIFETKMRATAGKLSNTNNSFSSALPYELRVVEAALASVTAAIEAEYQLARQQAGRALTSLDSQVLDKDEALIHTEMRSLLGLVRKLAAVEQRARAVRSALQDVMDENQDMADMYLTDRAAGKAHEILDHQEVEYMLEAYYKASDGVAQGAQWVMANIQRTDETIQSILNVRRNQIMVLDTKIEIAMLGLAAATLVAGYLGMNVINYMEESAFAFPLLVVGSMAGTGWIWWRFLRRLKTIQRGRHRL